MSLKSPAQSQTRRQTVISPARHLERLKIPNIAFHLDKQAARARKLASESPSPIVAELWEYHANLCELHAELRRQGRFSRRGRCARSMAETS